MSYTLHIWEKPSDQPWPTGMEEADKLLHTLHATRQAQNPKFIALAKKLTRRYPCITSARAERLPESDLAWSDGPLDGKTDTAVYGVGARLSRHDEVQPFVVEQARALGLNVTDDLTCEVFLANGAVLRAPGAKPSSGERKDQYADVPRPRDLEPLVRGRLGPLLKANGFKELKSGCRFKRRCPGGWQELVIFFEGHYWPVESQFYVTTFVRLDSVSDAIRSFLSPERAPNKHEPTVVAGHDRWLSDDDMRGFHKGVNREYVVKSFSEIQAVLDHLYGKLESRVLPVLEQCKTIQGFDAVLNPDPVTSSVFFSDSYAQGYKHVMAAYLAKNPRLEAICELFEEKTRGLQNYPPLIALTRKAIDYARSNKAGTKIDS